MVVVGHEDVIRTRTHPTEQREPAAVVKFHAPEIVFGLGALADLAVAQQGDRYSGRGA